MIDRTVLIITERGASPICSIFDSVSFAKNESGVAQISAGAVVKTLLCFKDRQGTRSDGSAFEV